MNPRRIRATNLRTFETLDLEIPAGATVIAAPNGSGKSTLLDAIDVALFADRGELAAMLTLGEEELELTLEFEHAGELYRVRRGYSGRGRGKTTLDLEQQLVHDDDDPVWDSLTRETAVATQQHLEKILGLSRATFRASSFLAQGNGAAFTEAHPRDRKAMLAEILGLGVWDALLERARSDGRSCELEVARVSSRLETLTVEAEQLPTLEAALADARVKLDAAVDEQAQAQAQVDHAREEQTANAARVGELKAAQARLAAVVERQQRHTSAVEDAQAAQQLARTRRLELEEADKVAGTVPGLEQRLETAKEAVRVDQLHRTLVEQAEQHTVRADLLLQQRAMLEIQAVESEKNSERLDAGVDAAATCDRCGQHLGAEAAKRAAQSFRDDAAGIRARGAELVAQSNEAADAAAAARARADELDLPVDWEPVDLLERQLLLARTAVEQRATLAAQIEQLELQAATAGEHGDALAKIRAEREAAEQEVEAVAATVVDEAELRQQAGDARLLADIAQSRLDEVRGNLVRVEQQLEHAQTAAVELEQLHGSSKDLHAKLTTLKLAERAFGRDGIPALIVENTAIPQLEVEANRILGELGGTTAGCRVELRTQRLLKTTEALRETLDIVIVTPAGARPYESFSGGERTRLNLALRIALARLLASRRGAESRLLAIDEPDGLDAAGMDALVAVLQGLTGTFDRMLVVSHQPQLAGAFDQTISVVKDGDRSRVIDETAVAA